MTSTKQVQEKGHVIDIRDSEEQKIFENSNTSFLEISPDHIKTLYVPAYLSAVIKRIENFDFAAASVTVRIF